MILQIECREVKGWPMMYATKCIPQGGDKLRLQNFGVQRFNDFKAFCDKQREATKAAMEGKKIRSSTRFTDIILESMLGKPFDVFVQEKIDEAIERYKQSQEGK